MPVYNYRGPRLRHGDIVYFYVGAQQAQEPPYAVVVKEETHGRLTLHVWHANARQPEVRRNVRHIDDPSLLENPTSAAREGCWITSDEHYRWLDDKTIVVRHSQGATCDRISAELRPPWTPQKVSEALKRFDLTPNKLPREMATT